VTTLSAPLSFGDKSRAPIALQSAKSRRGKRDFSSNGTVKSGGNEANTPHEPITSGLAVYYVPHVLDNSSAAALSSLTAADYREFAYIEHIGARNRSLVTRAALRRALSEVTQGALAPSQWVFIRGRSGKPQLDPSCPQVHFSCSHADGVSVVAVSTRGPVGIDIANTTTPFDLSLAELFLSPGEARTLGDCSDASPAQRQAFCRFWALKEAYLKMNGDALSEHVSELEFDPVKDQLASKSAGEKAPGQAKFKTWQLAAERRSYSAAIAFVAA